MNEFDNMNSDFNTDTENQVSENASASNEVEIEAKYEKFDNAYEEFDNAYEEFTGDESPAQFEQQIPPVHNKIEYTPVVPKNDYKPASKGLKVFSIILVAVVLLTGSCLSGFFLGKNSVSIGGNKKVTVDLAAKPKDTDPYTVAQIYEMVNESVVGIHIYNSNGSSSQASGIFYSEDGYIVTNDHIYSEIGAPKFKVYTHDGTEYDAVYVAGDVVSDLAVLKIKGTGKFKKATFGDSEELVCGESVTAIGRPNDATDESSITSGVVSLTERRVTTTSSYSARLIQTDSAINPGSSGGALVNMYGQVVGVTSSKLSGEAYDDIGFAIPTTTVKRIVEQLISDGKVTDRAKLGITYSAIDSVTAEINNYSNVGLYVVSVSDDSDLYSKVKEGDVITAVNGQKVTRDEIVLDIIENSKAGDTITVTVVTEKGTTKEFNAKLGANVGESSYTDNITTDENGKESSGNGTFDFPFGE